MAKQRKAPASTEPEAKAAPGAACTTSWSSSGIAREQDLVLHLPLRYEDHTRLVPLARAAAPGMTAQAEGVVVNTDIQYRPRRQLVALIGDDGEDKEEGRGRSSSCASSTSIRTMQKALSPGQRVRVFGEVREGHFGREIVHPQFKVVEPGAPLPDRLTPGLSDHGRARAGDAAQGDGAGARRPIRRSPRRRCPTG